MRMLHPVCFCRKVIICRTFPFQSAVECCSAGSGLSPGWRLTFNDRQHLVNCQLRVVHSTLKLQGSSHGTVVLPGRAMQNI